ncbi:Coatomer beta subunit [Parasponia andersonii]|uniref:Coatomer beta subunit n=1 Tax=Parasponia andersonii TaxID=3476 RepID=A0A2P5DG60_PARAD|nr:Coatomer beta subunit [Parasponia andersonii]
MAAVDEEKTLQEELSLPILLADRVIKSAQEAESSKQDCSELAKQVDRLSQMLRSAVRIASTTQSFYEKPIRRIVADVTKNLDRALTLVRKVKHSGVLRQVFSITTTADFRKVSSLLESSIGDMKWVLSIFDADGANLSLPPIASNDPILSWVWSSIATVQMGQLKARVDAANELASLARDNDRNKKIIVDEGGVTPLLKLLKEGSSPEAQIAAANALFNIATDRERVRFVADALGVPTMVQVLGNSPTRVQLSVVKMVASMAELDSDAQEEFARENVTRPLVSFLAIDTVLDDPNFHSGKTSIHSIVQINKELVGKSRNSYPNSTLTSNASFSSSHHSDGSSRGGHHRKEREVESPEVKLKLKVGCAEALWKLCKKSLTNSRKVTETKGLICLAKIIEKEEGELQLNCLLTVMEIAAVAESNPDLRRAAFKTNSSAAKAVLDQLLRVIQAESSPALQIPAITSIGCLARTFPARETRILGPLVSRLGDGNVDVATEAAIALSKFVSPENFNCVEHSKAIIEFEGVPPLMRLLRTDGRAQIQGTKLLCYLALHVGNSKALEQARALNALEGARSAAAQHPDLREVFPKAIHHLALYQAGAHPHRQSYAP